MSSILSNIIQWWYSPRKKEKSDVERTIPEIIESRGFNCQIHEVTTTDGYILTMFRIVNPYSNQNIPNSNGSIPNSNQNIANSDSEKSNIRSNYPILCMHGMGGNASQFIVTSDDGYLKNSMDENMSDTDNNLSFFLSKRGYDVWVGNMRGSRYGLKHINPKYSLESEEFWNFTMDDVVKYDLTAFIEHIRTVTSYENVGYVGVSLGTTVMFGLLSSAPKYNEIVQPFISLSPCYRLYNMRSPLRGPLSLLSNIWYKYPRYAPEFSIESELNLQKKMIEYPVKNVISTHIFWTMMGLLGGYNHEQFDFDRVCVYAAHGASMWWPWKMLIHSSQYVVRNIPFSMFDYGKETNMKLYGQYDAPLYDVSKITNRSMAFFYSKNDWACSVTDVNFLKDQLTGMF